MAAWPVARHATPPARIGTPSSPIAARTDWPGQLASGQPPCHPGFGGPSVTPWSIRLQHRDHRRLRRAAGDVDAALTIHEDVHLAANAELRQVDPRFDAEARARQDAARL